MGFPQYNILDDGDLEEVAQTIYIDGVKYAICESDNLVFTMEGGMIGTYIDNKWSFINNEKHMNHLKNISNVMCGKLKRKEISCEEFSSVMKRNIDKIKSLQ